MNNIILKSVKCNFYFVFEYFKIIFWLCKIEPTKFIIVITGGPYGGKKCYEALLIQFTRVGAMPIKEHFQVNNVNDSIDDDGNVLQGEYEALSSGFAEKIINTLQI